MRRDPNGITKHAVPRSRSEKREQPTQRRFTLSLLAFVVFGLSLLIWQRSSSPQRTEEMGHQRAQNDLELGSRSTRASSNRAKSLAPAFVTPENHDLEDIRAVILAAQALEDPVEQDAAWSRLLNGMHADLAAILLASLSPEELNEDAAQRLFDHWASAKPSEAAAWAQNQGESNTRQAFLELAALRWSVTDLSSAATWARNLPEGESRLEILRTIASEALRGDPLEALRLADELPTSKAKEDLISRATVEWAAIDPDNAAKWLGEIENVALRRQLTVNLAVAAAEQDPAASATIILEQMRPGKKQDRAVVSIVQRWAQTDPEAAAAWVSKFPEGALGKDAMDNLVNLWADRDLVASGNWLLRLQEGELRNAGILAYARKLYRTDPVLAKRWEASVSGGQ